MRLLSATILIKHRYTTYSFVDVIAKIDCNNSPTGSKSFFAALRTHIPTAVRASIAYPCDTHNSVDRAQIEHLSFLCNTVDSRKLQTVLEGLVPYCMPYCARVCGCQSSIRGHSYPQPHSFLTLFCARVPTATSGALTAHTYVV